MKKLTLPTIVAVGIISIGFYPSYAHCKANGSMHFFDLIDVNDDNFVTREEAIQFLDSKFVEVDTNKDGRISLDEKMNHLRLKKEEFKAKWKATKELKK